MKPTINDFSNVSEFFRDFAVACTCGNFVFPGIFDRPDDTFGMGGVNVQSTNFTLLVAASDVSRIPIVEGTSLMLQSKTYIVRDVLALDDGAVFQLTLTRSDINLVPIDGGLNPPIPVPIDVPIFNRP